MKIYTKTGDKGETAMYGGSRRSKADARICAYGEVDELQAVLGLCHAHLEGCSEIRETLEEIQRDLFIICCELARTETKLERHDPVLPDDREAWLEALIDRLDENLPKLTTFIVQGGSPAGAQLHVARSVCRRAERAVVSLSVLEDVRPVVMRYMNRLSDYLFMAAREVNSRHNCAERPLTV